MGLTGLNLVQTIRYSAEPSSFYLSGDTQLHGIIQIWVLVDVLENGAVNSVGFCFLVSPSLILPIDQIPSRKLLWREQQLP